MRSIFKMPFLSKWRKVAQDATVGFVVRGKKRTAFRLSPTQLRGHSVLIGRAGTGKTTLSGHLANAAMQNGAALIVIDMEGDLVPNLIARIPRKRAEEVCLIDLSNESHVPGWNLLDVSHGDDADLIFANLARTAVGLWGKYWNPHAEKALGAAVRIFIAANRVLVQRGEPQFTLLDVPVLFESADFRRRILKFLSAPDLTRWENGHLESLEVFDDLDLMATLITPLHTLVADSAADVLGQSTSTFNPRELLEPGHITLLNASGMALLPEMRRWLAALLADRVNLLVMDRQASSGIQATSLVVAVNGNLQIPYLDDPEFLAELQRAGASYILPYWFVRAPDTKGPGLPQALLEKARNLFIFHPTGCDAELLSAALGGSMSSRDFFDLPYHACYVQTHAENGGVLVQQITTARPPKTDQRAAERTLARIKSCARSATDVSIERQQFFHKWHRDELAVWESCYASKIGI